MKSYSKAPNECSDRVRHLIMCFYSELRDAGLKVDLLTVATDTEDAHALTHNGYPADAVIRVLDSKQRAKGHGDVEIVIDEARYLTMTDAEKDGLLDHELYHVELRRNKKGRVKLDEHGRPKCGMRKHDFQVGWFHEIARRHGAASGEVQQARELFLNHQQTYFAFVDVRPSAKQLVEKIDGVLSDDAGPSAEVRRIAKEISTASPAVQAAARNLVSHLKKHNATMTMRVGDETEKRVIATGDGRQITATEMMGEIKERLAVEAYKP